MKPEKRKRVITRQLSAREKSPKKLRIDEVATSDAHFLDMNDDCIEMICTFLPLDDLCSYSRTCKRIQAIAGDYFQRLYPNNRIQIKSFHRRSVLHMYPDEKYVEDLKPFIRNVSIQEYKGSACVNYLKVNFCENLREIALHGINCSLNETHGAFMKDQLKCLESIKFVNCSVGDIHGIFLKHCQNLKHLGIDEPVQFNGRVTWTQHAHPTLQSLTYFDEANTNRADLSGFLRRNEQIKYIACKGSNVHCTIFARAKQLDMLVLCFNKAKEFARNFKLLKKYSEESQTQRIQLEFNSNVRLDLENFTKIASIQRIYGYRGYLVEQLQITEIIRSLENLRVLQLFALGNVSQIYIKRLAGSLSNLEELHFTAIDMSLSFKNFFLPFCQNPNIKKIVIFSEQLQYRCTRSDIVDINRKRESLDSCDRLIIYMEKKVINEIKFKIPEKSKVIIKPLSELTRDIHAFH